MMESTGAGVSLEELGLAARNHGMPLEALSDDVTPVGLHYLLTHYDIPHIDCSRWRLVVDGRGTRVELSLDELQAMPAVTRRVTMECAGNGRAFSIPGRRASPGSSSHWARGGTGGMTTCWLLPAGGGRTLVFSGADAGIEQCVDQFTSAACRGSDDRLMLAYVLNGLRATPHCVPMRLS